MKQLIVSLLLLLVATLVFSQAESDSQDKSATNEAVKEQPVQMENALVELI
ncbi:hypothetical protein [Formosa sp. PL04]|uniref:hypothetical protein n=1 Tax=Formosa sp. PL04 TaxID=3081755 RepID=UPI002981D50A|nr:hypothetical protein [Formosa sp. PL04]MDW5287642.1 hypothetical protein [Formosa sp. PL04]